eukprot:433464-Prorocentrum_minimum.AAC.1
MEGQMEGRRGSEGVRYRVRYRVRGRLEAGHKEQDSEEAILFNFGHFAGVQKGYCGRGLMGV